ncbi:MAG: TerC family protein [Actinobacteria bacterium]|nr:TerC family protein [Actinomycetota bacterium]
MEYLPIIMSILMFDLILGGDNAVVIALASRNLPPGQQKKAILLSTAGAIVLRVLLTIVIVFLLKIPFLKALGGLFLVYIAVKLLKEDNCRNECRSAGSLVEAVKVIIFADLIMSLDNILAIAAVSRGHWGLIIIGLTISIPIIVSCSQVILYLMKRFPAIIYAGAGILAWTAGKMILEDYKVSAFLQLNLNDLLGTVSIVLPLIITAAVIGYGLSVNLKNQRVKNIEHGAS